MVVARLLASGLLCAGACLPLAAQAEAARPSLNAASRDPFSARVVPAPIPVAIAPPPPPVVPVMAAPLPIQEPLPSLSFAGRMHTPDGRVVVLARWADGTPVSLEQGKALDNGYRVERLTDHSVELVHPGTQAMVQLPLPVPPRFEVR